MRRASQATIIVVLVVALVLSACQPGMFPLIPTVTPTPVSQEEINKAVVLRHIEEYWNQGKLEVAKEVHAPDYTFYEQTNPPVRGRDAYDQIARMYLNAFPDLHFTIEDLIVAGDKVVERWSCTGTHQGELMGIPPTGKEVRTTGISIFRVANGQIVEEWANWSTLSLLQQLGAIPMPASVLNQVHQGFEEALNAHDVDRMLSFFADDAVYDYVPVPTPLSKDEIRGFFESVFQSFPDFSSLPGREFLVGNIRVLEHPVEGTHQGEWMGIPPTGKKFPTPHIDIFEYEGDKIKRLTTYIDISRILIQLGAMPAPELPELKPSFELPDPEPTGLSPLEAQKEAMARWNAHDLVSWAKMFHPDVDAFYGPIGVPMDREALVALQELYIQAFPDIQGEITRMIDLGNGWVLTETVFQGKNDGPFFGVPATGRLSNVRIAWLAQFDADGLVTYFHVYFDNLTVLQQLGLVPAQPTPQTELNKEIVRRYAEEVWSRANLDAIDELVGDGYVFHDPVTPGAEGREALKQLVTAYHTAFPGLRFIIEDLIAEGDMVVARWRTTPSPHQGELMGIPPTGKLPMSPGITLFRLVDGKVVEEWARWDALGMMQQLGLVPTMGREEFGWSEPSTVTGDPGDPETNKAIVRRYTEEVWNAGNLDVLPELMSADVVHHESTMEHQLPRGLEAHKQAILIYRTAFPDLRSVHQIEVAEGDKVAVLFRVTGTHQGELMGIPPTGKKVEFTGINIHRFADGKIVETWWAWDALGLLQQIGAIPAPGQGGQ